MTPRHAPAPVLAAPMTSAAPSLAGWAAVVLAGGAGTRMRSALPKALHPVAGVPMLRLVCDLLRTAGCTQIVVVSGASPDAMSAVAGPHVRVVTQGAPLGTAHAALAAREVVGANGPVLLLHADMPLLTIRTLLEMAGRHLAAPSSLTFLTAYVPDPKGYNRVERRNAGDLRIGVLHVAVQSLATEHDDETMFLHRFDKAFDAGDFYVAKSDRKRCAFFRRDATGAAIGDVSLSVDCAEVSADRDVAVY